MIRIGLADDHRIVREGLRALLSAEPDIEIVCEASDGASFLEKISTTTLDVAVLDIHMPGTNGFALAEQLRKSHPLTVIAFLTSRKDPDAIHTAMELGAKAFVLKDDAFDDLSKAIHEAAEGRPFISAGLARTLTEFPQPVKQTPTLAPREKEVLELIANGLQNKEIAHQLEISVNTVRTHRARLMEKLDLHSGPELVRFALEHRMTK